MKDLSALRLFLLVFAISALAACQTVGAQTSSEPEQAASTEEIAAQDIEFVVGTGPFFLDDARAGLADLSSYTATLTRNFEGSIDGEPQSWSESYVMLRDNTNSASQLIYTSTLGDTEAITAFYAEEGQNAYEKLGEEACLASETIADPSSIERVDPAGMLPVVLGGEEAGTEDINGISANHYSFDEIALGKSGLEESSGGVWVAADGGYVLKYELTTNGGDTAFGEGIEGTLTLTYALTEINNTVLPAMPEGCQLDVPLLADATNVLHTSYWLQYNTATSAAEAAAFYQGQLPSTGWSLSQGPMSGEGSAFMEFTQGAQTIGVFINTTEASTTVNVVLYYAEN
jgi:hypothetical protein